MGLDVTFTKDFMSYLKSAGVNPDDVNNDQELWKVIRGYEEARQTTIGKAEVNDLKDYLFSKAFKEGNDLYKVESKQNKGGIKEMFKFKKKGKSVNESAITDFTINAKADVEGLGSGKVTLITPDSVTVRFADDTEKVFVADELYKVSVQKPEAAVEPEAPAPEVAPEDATPADLPVPSESKIAAATKNLLKVSESNTKSIEKVTASLKKLQEAFALMIKEEEDVSGGEAGAGIPTDDKGKIDQEPNVPAGTEIEPIVDADADLSSPKAIAAEARKIAAKHKITVESAVAIIGKHILKEEDASGGEAGAGLPADDKDETANAGANVPAGTEVPATADPSKDNNTAEFVAQESRKNALKKKLHEQKILCGVAKTPKLNG